MQKWKDHVNKCVQIHVQFIFDIYWTLKKVGTRTWRLIFPPSKRVKLNPFRHTTVHCNLTPIVLQDVNSHWLLSFWRPNEILKTNINFDATKGQNILKHYYWCGFFFFFFLIHLKNLVRCMLCTKICDRHMVMKEGRGIRWWIWLQEAVPEEAKPAFLGWVQLTVMLMMVSYLEGRQKTQQFY